MSYRRLAFSAAVCVIQPVLAIAAPISLVNLPGNYIPGSSLTFDVVLPPISNLGAYNIDLMLMSPTGVASTDFFFDVNATVPSPSAYVFSDTANYFDAANADSQSVHRLSLTDFDFSGVAVVTGVNDHVARVVIGTAADFGGELTVAFDATGLILDTPDATPTAVTEYATIRSDTEALGSIIILPVPEPAALGLLLIGGMTIIAGGRIQLRSTGVRSRRA